MKRPLQPASVCARLAARPRRARLAQAANISPPPDGSRVAGGSKCARALCLPPNRQTVGPGDGGFSLTRTLAQPVIGHNNPFANFSHDWEILLSEKRIDIIGGHFAHSVGYPDYQIEIAFGGLSQTFRAIAGTSFEQVSRSGWARLSHSGSRETSGVVYTLQTGDGSSAVFRALGSNDCSSQLRCAYVAHMIRADGTRFDFGYDNPGSNATRLRSVTSNRGFALLLESAAG